MLPNSKKLATRLGALLAVAALFVAGCDMLGQDSGSDALLRVTNDLGQRMTVFPQGKTVPASNRKAAPAKSAFTLRAVSRISPPNSGQRASHISKTAEDADDHSIFVGYKVRGSTFGGGIDIIDASDPTHLGNEDNALRSENLDVQEVLYDVDGDDNKLYIAGAVDFGKIDARDYGNTPAVILRGMIDDDGNVETSDDGDVQVIEAAMPDHLVKGLSLKPHDNHGIHGNAQIYAVTDSHILYSFGANLGLRNATEITDTDVEFTSVTSQRAHNTATAQDVFTLGDDGNVYKFRQGGNVSEEQNFSDLTTGGIARLNFHSHPHSGADNVEGSNLNVIYAALNEGGLAVLGEEGEEVVYEKTDQYYVSVVGAEHDVNDDGNVARVFAAGPNGTIDVFEVTNDDELRSGSSTSTSKGLQLLGSFDLGGLEEQGIGSDPLGSGQVNQIVVEDDHLFVAAGSEGVLTLEIAENEGDIFQ